MASNDENFYVSGPLHLLNFFDWRNEFHRRCIAASLVKGVYILEKDRQRERVDQNALALAPPWWEPFHFQLCRTLIDEKDNSYFGAIFEYKYAFCFDQSSPHPPRYFVVFRGTITRCPTVFNDMILNKNCIFDELKETSRFATAFHAVLETVAMAGQRNVWLAGHSLGAAIAMQVGKWMAAKYGCPLESYLFNPPFISIPFEMIIKNRMLMDGIRITASLIKAGLATAMNLDREEDQFTVLSAWSPYVFVNPSDPICVEYIEYFENWKKMESSGLGNIERIAAKVSIVRLVYGAIGRDSEPLHLLPTAYVTVNNIPSEIFDQAHGIRQWWQHHFQWQAKLYKFNRV